MSDFQKELDEKLNRITFDNEFEDLYQTIIDEIVAARKVRGLSQSELSKRTGIPQANISKIENGSANPSLKLLIRLAQGLNKKIVIKFE